MCQLRRTTKGTPSRHGPLPRRRRPGRMCRHHHRMRHRLRRHGSDSNPAWRRRPMWIPLQLKVVRRRALLVHRTTTVSRARPRRDTTRAAGDPLMVSGRPHLHVRNRRRSVSILNAPDRRRTARPSHRPAMAGKVSLPVSARPAHPARSARAAGRTPSVPRWGAGRARRPVSGRGRPRCSRAVTSASHRFEITWRAGYPLAKHRRPGPGTRRRPTRVRSARAPLLRLLRLLRRNAASSAHRTGAPPEPGRVSRAAGQSSGAPSLPRQARGIGRTQIRSVAASWCPPARFRHRAAGAAPCS
jgi:hypothetical protein